MFTTPEARLQVLLKECDLIQAIVKRMASNSFLLKGWAITLVVGSLLLKGNKYEVLISFLPLFVFWFLDAFFLRQERAYRKLYEWVIEHRATSDEYLLDMDAGRLSNQVDSTARIMFSTTLGIFYGVILVVVIVFAATTLLAK
jgi:hypothetical protein